MEIIPDLGIDLTMTNNIPQDFANALESAGLDDFFSGCTHAHQREYLKWINEAKRPETRQTRITKAMQMLAGKRAEEEALRRSNPF